jgi:hypothetical protein
MPATEDAAKIQSCLVFAGSFILLGLERNKHGPRTHLAAIRLQGALYPSWPDMNFRSLSPIWIGMKGGKKRDEPEF